MAMCYAIAMIPSGRRVRCMAVMVLCLCMWPGIEAQAFWGSGKKQVAEAAVKLANDTIHEADAVWRTGDGDAAIKLYARAIDALLEVEARKYDIDMGAIRFRRAYCETQIDQVKFSQASKNERRVTVTSAPSMGQPATTVAASPIDTNAVAAVSVPVVASLTSTNAPVVLVNVTSEMAWACDMVELGRQDEAAATLVRVLKVDPVYRPARLMLATVRCRQGAFADALIILEDLRDEREDEAVLLALAGAYCGATRYYEALLALDCLLASDPRNNAANINMAYLLLEMSPGRQKEAELYYRQAIKLGAARDMALERRLGF